MRKGKRGPTDLFIHNIYDDVQEHEMF